MHTQAQKQSYNVSHSIFMLSKLWYANLLLYIKVLVLLTAKSFCKRFSVTQVSNINI